MWTKLLFFPFLQASPRRRSERQPSNSLAAPEPRRRPDSGHLLWTDAGQAGSESHHEDLPHR